MEKSEKQLLADIAEKLDRLIGVSATQGRSEDQQIGILRGMGYDWKFIGLVVGMKETTARQRYRRMPKA